jgi:hypothetical protein
MRERTDRCFAYPLESSTSQLRMIQVGHSRMKSTGSVPGALQAWPGRL